MEAIDERELGRAKNAVLELFEDRFYIPKIYLDADWQGQRADVLAIDRDGIGDVHLALMVKIPEWSSVEHLGTMLEPSLHRILTLDAHYKYLALVITRRNHGSAAVAGVPTEILDRALAPDGLGRVGFLSVAVPFLEEPKAVFLVKPERFKARVHAIADDYVRQHTADWELRDSPAA